MEEATKIGVIEKIVLEKRDAEGNLVETIKVVVVNGEEISREIIKDVIN